MTKTYGDPKFTNPIMPDYPGSGAITYSSSDSAIATVNSDNGEVTIHKAGSAVIKAEKAQDPDYTSAQAEYQLTVGKKHLTVTADDKFISFGDPVPAYTYTFNGFANGDTEVVVSGVPVLSCAYTPASGKGSYPITIGTLHVENYEFIGRRGLQPC